MWVEKSFVLVYLSLYQCLLVSHSMFRKHSCERDVAGRKLYGQERVKHQESWYCKPISRLDKYVPVLQGKVVKSRSFKTEGEKGMQV